jgi:hypothetical protein
MKAARIPFSGTFVFFSGRSSVDSLKVVKKKS